MKKRLPLGLRAYERQRAAEGRTIALRPSVVRVSEPTAPKPPPVELLERR